MISDPATYSDILENFLVDKSLNINPNPIKLFHAVRSIPYCSIGKRRPEDVILDNEGSCSGKHILLRDLLRHIGEKAEIETIEGDFSASIPSHDSMTAELKEYCKVQNVTDFHHYVIWHSADGDKKLDATWSDAMIVMGVPGNADWTGKGDTKLAVTPKKTLGRKEDIIKFKEHLLEQLSEDEREYRKKFLTLLTEWVSTISYRGGIK